MDAGVRGYYPPRVKGGGSMLGERFADVLHRAQAGDPEAFADLWREANPMLLRYLQVTTGPLAEDVASHTWLRAIESLSSFAGEEPGFRRWLVTIARNHHLDLVRRSGRRPEELAGDLVSIADAAELRSLDPAEVVEERLTTDWALRVIASLPRDQAELVMLRVVVGLDVTAVAELTGRTAGSVRVAVHRSLRKLRETLDAQAAAAVTQPVPPSFSDRHD
jgi:RNA polymerase sigma-70 factor, ECF subfamily